MKTIQIIGVIPALICLLIIIIFNNKLQPKWLRLFIYFLLFTLASETGSILYSYFLKKSNHFIINIYSLVNFSFFFYIFYKAFEIKKIKSFIIFSFALFLLFSLINIIFIEGFYLFNVYTYSLGSIFIVWFCMLYFMYLFKSDKVINFFAIPMFWIATGLLFFYVGSLIQMTLINYIVKNHIDTDGLIFQFIMVTLNILLYGAFTVGFLCNRPWIKEK
jgi:hypothetical protein